MTADSASHLSSSYFDLLSLKLFGITDDVRKIKLVRNYCHDARRNAGNDRNSLSFFRHGRDDVSSHSLRKIATNLLYQLIL